MSSGPKLTIAKNAFRHIKDARLDVGLYTSYLETRNVPENEYGKLELAIDDKYMCFGGHGVYLARDNNDHDSLHIIGLSPSLMPICVKKQGKNLRHETEHFIYQIHHPNHLRNRKILVGGATALGAAMGVTVGVKAGIDMSHSLPVAAEIPIDAVSGLTGAGLGSLAAFLPACMGHIALGPSEIQAEWAEHRRRFELPDGVLQVEFA